MTQSPAGRWWIAAARIAVSAVALWLVARWLDVPTVLERLSDLRPGWIVLGLAISVAQVVLLAWRWRYTAARLGIELPMREAIGEYYLGILLNQLLPGGVAGDVSRAWRHARSDVPTGPAVRAVILERVSAQVVMTVVTIVSLMVPLTPWFAGAVGAVVVAAALSVGVRSGFSKPAPDSLPGRFWADTKTAVLARDAWPVQLVSATLVVASYIAVFVVAARAVGTETPTAAFLPLVAPVLQTMLIPVTVAGWGVREASAAALWTMVGLTAEDGAAISVAYGLLVLASSAPGLYVLIRLMIGGRGRTARPPRAGSDATGA